MTDPRLAALVGERVQVYRNLRRGDWSVRVKGRVVAHVPEVTLATVRFVVSEAGRQRVLRRKERSVHAWAEGEVVAHGSVPAASGDGTVAWSVTTRTGVRCSRRGAGLA